MSASDVDKFWVLGYLEELQSMPEDDLIEPIDEIDLDHETLVGEAVLYQRQLHSACERLKEKAGRAALDARFARTKESKEELAFEATSASVHAGILDEILMYEISQTFHLWEHPTFAIRKGWQVAWSDEYHHIVDMRLDSDESPFA